MNQRLPYLDGWRFIAVTLVVLNHLLENSGFGMANKGYWHGPWGNFEFPANLGIFGVHIFFVISGYVIARGLQSEGDSIQLFDFWVRRAARILPPFYFYLLIIIVLGALGAIEFTPREGIKAGLFLCNILGCGWWAGHSWSLDFEEQFYIVLPLLFMFSPRRTIPLFYAMMVALAMLNYKVGVNFSFLLLGVLCARYSLPFSNSRIVLFGSLTYLLFNALVIQTALTQMMSAVFAPPAIGYLLFSNAQQMFHRWLTIGWLVKIGQASYGIYLWQQLVTGDLLGPNLFWYVPAIVTVYALPYFVFTAFERPLQERVKRWLARRRRIADPCGTNT